MDIKLATVNVGLISVDSCENSKLNIVDICCMKKHGGEVITHIKFVMVMNVKNVSVKCI